MTDLRRLLDQAAPAPDPVSRAVVEADLARARRGRRHHLALRGTRSGVVAAAAAAAVVLTTQQGLLAGADPGSTHSRPSVSQRAGATALVAYTGPSLVGFTIEQVPVGWVVEGVDRGALTLVPVGQQHRGAERERAADGVRALQGRIAVWRSDRLPQRAGTAVEVDGIDGVVVTLDNAAGEPLGGYSLFLPQPVEGYLTIQVPAELGWSVRQLVEFSRGVHMTDGALTTGG